MRKAARGQDPRATKPVVTADGLWDELQALVKHMRYLCGALTWKSHSQGRYMARRA